MNDWKELFPPEVCEVLRLEHPDAYREVVKAFRNPKSDPPWWVVILVTILASADAVTPYFPFPGSAVIMVPLAGAVWMKKLASYGATTDDK